MYLVKRTILCQVKKELNSFFDEVLIDEILQSPENDNVKK